MRSFVAVARADYKACMGAVFKETQLKRVYFVRHGSTEAIEMDAFQLFETPLSARGLEQAKFVAKRFKNIPVERIISSTMVRALETAHEIGTITGCTVTESSFFQEILRPSAIQGRRKDDPEVGAIYDAVIANFANPEKRHSDEENFFDIKTRAQEALQFLEAQPERAMVVVTHGVFLRMLIATMLHGEAVSPEASARLDSFLHTDSTGITECILTEERGWRLWTWNDSAHLGEVH